jgi:hypothetical protein
MRRCGAGADADDAVAAFTSERITRCEGVDFEEVPLIFTGCVFAGGAGARSSSSLTS